MSFNLLNTAALAGLELLINNILKLDPRSQEKISRLSGSVIKIKSLTPAFSMYIIIKEPGLRLSTYHEGGTTASFTGSSAALLKLLLSKEKNLYDKDIEVTGDMLLAQNLQQIFSSMNIDWEFHLAKFIGDISTQQLSDLVLSTKKVIVKNRESLLMDIDEYIHEEKKLFPTVQELESFYSLVDELRLKLDRTEARLEEVQIMFLRSQ